MALRAYTFHGYISLRCAGAAHACGQSKRNYSPHKRRGSDRCMRIAYCSALRMEIALYSST